MAEVDDDYPGWVVPDEFALSDVGCLALRGVMVPESKQACVGIIAALGWVRGVFPGAPVTGRREPVNARLAEAESWAAAKVCYDSMDVPVEEFCARLGVRAREPLTVDRGFALGVCGTLRWLVGCDESPPLPVPVRTLDGQPASAKYIYARMLAGADWTLSRDEQERLRVEATRLAARSRELAAMVLQTAVGERGG